MRFARLAEVAFCLLASPGVLVAQVASPEQAENSRREAKAEQAMNVSTAVPEEVESPHAVRVAQLSELVEASKGKSDEDAAKEIEQLELTERLSSPELARLSGELPGAQSKVALMAVGDASVFLELPKSEMLDKATPDSAEQQQIVSRALDYLKTTIPKLPDFYAKRITTAFNVVWAAQDKHGSHKPAALHLTGRFNARVLYRNGKEVVNAEGAEGAGLMLTTQGTFGPILSTVITDNLRSPMQWRGWEKGPNGAMAVLQFHVSQKDSHYGVSFPMAGLPGARRTGYHGEIGIDPDTGTILRLVLQSDPVLGIRAVEHADIMLEYGTVVIGGKAYTCPVRGVSISRAGFQQAGIVGRNRSFILLDDVIFTDYHVFRSEMRILPE
jgi:hypothetical protein